MVWRTIERHEARCVYNVADALVPPGDRSPLGGGDADVWPAVAQALRQRGRRAQVAAWLLLVAIEWRPLLSLRRRRRFSWLPRAVRRAELRRFERSRLAPVRAAYAKLSRTLLAAVEADPRLRAAGSSAQDAAPLSSPA